MEGHELKEQLVAIQINAEDRNNLEQLIDPAIDDIKPGIYGSLGSVPVYINPSVPKGKIHFVHEYNWVPTPEYLAKQMGVCPIFDYSTGKQLINTEFPG